MKIVTGRSSRGDVDMQAPHYDDRDQKPTYTLELRGLSKTYGTEQAVRAIDLTVYAGEFLTILGPSGSGKTTILRLVAGFMSPTAGAIYINGRNVSQVPPRARQIGMVQQNYSLFPHMTVEQNVGYGLKMRGQRKRERGLRVSETLALVGLKGFEQRLPRQLSGGQQQRVALARALAFEPALLLMDEPLGALDRELRVRMGAELSRIHSELGTTVLYVTHDREEALTLSDRIAIMHHGQIEAVDTPRNLYTRPISGFVAAFFGGHNLVRGIVRGRGKRGNDGRVVVVECLGRVVEIPAQSEFRDGEEALIAVPPESLRVADPESRGLVFRGRVEQLAYLGQSLQLRFSTGEQELLTASLPLSEDCPEQRGAEVLLVADTDQLIAVTSSPASDISMSDDSVD